jgi:hypothetical protein
MASDRLKVGSNTLAYTSEIPAAAITQLTGDVTAGPGSGSQAATIANNAVTDAKLRDSAALSVVGRSANSTGDPADIAAGSDHQVLRRSGTALDFGAVALDQAAAVSGLLPLNRGGTGQNSALDAAHALLSAYFPGVVINADILALTSQIVYGTTGSNKATIQALYNLINSLTAETAPVAADKLALYDDSASQTDAITYGNLMGAGKVVSIAYTGNGSSGRTVTLTGINRAHWIMIFRYTTTDGNSPQWMMPIGNTGTQIVRDGGGFQNSTCSLDAPAAGTSQVLTINNTLSQMNQNTIAYRIIAIGTPI